MKLEIPETLHEAIRWFSEGDNALQVMIKKRWPDGVICPHCQSANVLFMAKAAKWQCRGCRKQFTVKVGTIFEDSPIKLDKWLSALWMITGAKNGISSCELHRALGVTQKTAWFMLHRIRLAMQSGSIVKDKMTGVVQVDESYIGGAARFMHKAVKERRGIKQGSTAHKTPVMALLEKRERMASRVVAHVAEGMPTQGKAMGNLRKYVLKGAEVHSDESTIYGQAGGEYAHKVVNHAMRYVENGVHINGLENFWSLLKRAIKGTYVSVEPFHLHRYLSEQVLRFNERKHEDGDRGRFEIVLSQVFGKRITFAKLTGKDDKGKELLP